MPFNQYRKTDRRKEGQFNWTDENFAETLRLYNLGWPASKIAIHIGARTRNQVIGKLNRRSVVKSGPLVKTGGEYSWTDERLELLAELVAASTLADAAKKLGLPTTKVYDKARKLGLGPFLPAREAAPKPVQTRGKSAKNIGPAQIMESGPPAGITILELRLSTCRWPIGGSGAEMKYCGAHADHIYCRPHQLKAWVCTTSGGRRAGMRGALWAAR